MTWEPASVTCFGGGFLISHLPTEDPPLSSLALPSPLCYAHLPPRRLLAPLGRHGTLQLELRPSGAPPPRRSVPQFPPGRWVPPRCPRSPRSSLPPRRFPFPIAGRGRSPTPPTLPPAEISGICRPRSHNPVRCLPPLLGLCRTGRAGECAAPDTGGGRPRLQRPVPRSAPAASRRFPAPDRTGIGGNNRETGGGGPPHLGTGRSRAGTHFILVPRTRAGS